jgi:hypothetical protein
MPEMTQELWKGYAIHIRTIPVRHIVTRVSAPDGYIAIVQIERQGQVLADWHQPRYSERWVTAREAQRDALEYAVRLIDRGVLGESDVAQARAA